MHATTGGPREGELMVKRCVMHNRMQPLLAFSKKRAAVRKCVGLLGANTGQCFSARAGPIILFHNNCNGFRVWGAPRSNPSVLILDPSCIKFGLLGDVYHSHLSTCQYTWMCLKRHAMQS